jgi:hypothetical protein
MPEGLLRIIIGLAALVIGWAIGFFDSNMRAEKKIKAADERADLAIRQAQGEAERAAARVAQAEKMAASAPPSSPLPEKNLLRLWLDEKERPGLDLDGRQVDTSQISDQSRKRLISLVTVMRPWIEGKPTASVPAPQDAPVAQVPPPVSTPASAPVAATVAPSGKKNEAPAAPLSMVGQIDEILQARLASGPLANRGIRLQESPEGTVIVIVGVQKFSGVGDVPDPLIQSEIRAAIAEWEKKYTPGL